MKIIMYHYVRPAHRDLPYFRYLHVDDFKNQLVYFQANCGYVTQDTFKASLKTGESPYGVVLSFDDGFRDHYQYVHPLLKDRNLWGAFYIPTRPYLDGRMLDVHRIHMLLGANGGTAVLKILNSILVDSMINECDVDAFKERVYLSQSNDEATHTVKKILNYFISYEWREEVLDRLMTIFFDSEADIIKGFYLTREEIKEMFRAGHLIGSHTYSHPLMKKLTLKEQRRELDISFGFLEDLTGARGLSFCYPYGGFHSFSSETEAMLSDYGCPFSLNVEPRDVTSNDLLNRPQALPRYDCNLFPHGESAFGPERPKR